MATGEDMRADKQAYEKSDVVDKVAQTLAKFGEVEDSTPEPEPEPAEPKEPTPAEPKPAGDDDPTPKSEPVEPAEPAEPKEPSGPEKPAIPDNYYRAAIHQGWKPEQLSKLYEADPDGTLKMLEKTYNDVNNLSQQFAALGRKAREIEATKVQPVQQQPTQQPQGFDVEKFKKAYENDPATALVMAFQVLQQKPEPQPQPQPPTRDRRNEWEDHVAALEQLNTFFGADDLKPFMEYYGRSKSLNWGDLTPDQYAARQAVVNRADEILAGAEVLQKGMSVREAVELAHLELTAPILHKVVRQDILKQVQKRAKGATMRPSKSKSIVTPKAGEKLSEEQVLVNAEARLADLRSRGM